MNSVYSTKFELFGLCVIEEETERERERASERARERERERERPIEREGCVCQFVDKGTCCATVPSAGKQHVSKPKTEQMRLGVCGAFIL